MLEAFRWSSGLVTLVWCVALLNGLTGYALNHLGLMPRDPLSIPWLPIWVLLHADLPHLLVNTLPLYYMSFFVALRGPRLFLKVTVFVTLAAGLAVWLAGRSAIHIGASGLIFGYFGFLLAIAFYEQDFRTRLVDLAIASVTLFYYGGLFMGLVPVEPRISYEAHFFGFCAGLLAARLFSGRFLRR